jgi:hypothetical protein
LSWPTTPTAGSPRRSSSIRRRARREHQSPPLAPPAGPMALDRSSPTRSTGPTCCRTPADEPLRPFDDPRHHPDSGTRRPTDAGRARNPSQRGRDPTTQMQSPRRRAAEAQERSRPVVRDSSNHRGRGPPVVLHPWDRVSSSSCRGTVRFHGGHPAASAAHHYCTVPHRERFRHAGIRTGTRL